MKKDETVFFGYRNDCYDGNDCRVVGICCVVYKK